MVNDQYQRQQIAFAIPLALSGQVWRAQRGGILSFSFAKGAEELRLPFVTPFAAGWVSRNGDGLRLKLYAGELNATEVRYDNELVARGVRLGVGTHTLKTDESAADAVPATALQNCSLPHQDPGCCQNNVSYCRALARRTDILSNFCVPIWKFIMVLGLLRKNR